MLSSLFILVTLAYFGHKRDYQLPKEESDTLRYWVLVANAKGRYSRGSSETLLDQDLATLRQGGGAPELIDRLRLQMGRLDIAPEELEGRKQRSALFKTMFLAFRDANAKDWRSHLAIALDHSGAHHRLQFHHIFPKAVLKSKYSAREADDIANLSFVSGKTNRAISDKAPSSLLKSSKEVARKTLNLGDLARAPLAVPPVAEQVEIIRRVDELFGHVNSIQRGYDDAMVRAVKLTPSVLGEMLERMRSGRNTEGEVRSPVRLGKGKAPPHARSKGRRRLRAASA